MIQTRQRKKEAREERIILRLSDVGYATRKQLQAMERLGGDSNAHRILYRMEKERTLTAIRREQKIYYASSQGKRLIGCNKPNMKREQLDHTLMRNDAYIRFNMPKDWRNEVSIRRENKVLLVADAMYTRGNKRFFVEIDNVQTMRANSDKIKRYSDLFYDLKRRQESPAIIWYVRNKNRASKLRDLCAKHEIDYEIISEGGDSYGEKYSG